MLEKLGRLIVKKYKIVLILATLLTFILGFFMTKLKMNMQFMDLLPKKDKTVVAYRNAMKNFSSLDAIVAGVEGKERDIKRFIEEIAPMTKEIEGVDSVTYESEVKFLENNALLLQEEKDLTNMARTFRADSLKEFIAGINDNFEMSYISSGDTEKIDKDKMELMNFLNLLERVIAKIKEGKLSGLEAEKIFRGDRYILSTDKNMGLFIVKSEVSIDDVEGIVKVVNNLESFLKEKAKIYNVSVDITGSQVITRDEMVVSESDMKLTSIVSLVLMFLIFILAFRLIRYSVLALVPLIIGIIWSLGLTYFITGSLNIMTAMMSAILMGLGIDYSLHIISIFIEKRESGENLENSVLSIYTKVSKGVITGSITTAIGFLMFSFSDFPGFKQFGMVLGIGILATMLSAIIILPALLMIFGKKDIKNTNINFAFLDKIEFVVIRKKYFVLIFGIMVLIFLGFNAKRVRFEKDMMKIEAKGLKSVELNRKIIDKFDFSSDNSILISKSVKSAQQKYEEIDKLKTIGEISSIALYVPQESKQLNRMKIVKKIKNKQTKLVNNELYLTELSNELFRLEANIIELSDLAYMSGEKKLQKKCDDIFESEIIPDLAESIDKYETEVRISQNKFIAKLQSLVLNSNDSKIITVDDLPKKVKNEFIGKNGDIITVIYPKHDIWDAEFQKVHFQEIGTIGDSVTGTAKIFLKVVEAAASEGKRVLVYTVLAIFIVLLIDFKSLKYAVLAIVPMITAVLALVGIMGLTGFKFDVVNIIGLPLVIGIGVDDGIHIIHRYLKEKNLSLALKSTGKAVTLTTLTTIAAFGTLMLAKYRGFFNLGALLSMGVFLAYIMTVIFLISLIALFDKVKREDG